VTNTQVFAFPSTDLALLRGGKVDFHFMGFNPDANNQLEWTDLGAAATITQNFPADVATFFGATLTAGIRSAIGAMSTHSTSPAVLDGASFLVRGVDGGYHVVARRMLTAAPPSTTPALVFDLLEPVP